MPTLHAHPPVPQEIRAGAYPTYPGDGWRGEAFLNLPDDAAEHLVLVELSIADKTPDFTFRTHWIDFPMGEISDVADADLQTVGDFLDGYIFNVSDPSKLNEPMSHMALRFTGLVKANWNDEMRDFVQRKTLPLWMSYGAYGYDGFRVNVGVGQQCCLTPLPEECLFPGDRADPCCCFSIRNPEDAYSPWYEFGPSFVLLGLYPMTVTYFNNYDPDAVRGAPRAGFELYSWHGSEFHWPEGKRATHPIFGPMTLAPPWPIYQAGDELPTMLADIDGDADIDLEEFQWLQNCFGSQISLATGCDWVDFNADVKIDLTDAKLFESVFTGP